MSLEDKTEEPTARRRKEAREEGQVARSADLNSAIILLTSLLLLKSTGPGLISGLQGLLVDSLTSFPKHDLVVGDVSNDLVHLLLKIGMAIAPLLLGVVVVGFVVNVLQVGFVFSVKSLQFKGQKLNPLPGIANMFSARTAMELMKSIAKILVVGYLVYSFLQQNSGEIAGFAGAPFLSTCLAIGHLTWGLLIRAATGIFVIAAVDFMFQKQQLEKRLKMSKQEIKEDAKRSEGDPHIKSQIKQRQREMSRRRMMSEVPKADVVITNPTHFAVALKYDSDKFAAPVVIAKGQDLVAQKIKAIAKEHNIPTVENVPLARALHATVEIGNPIPEELYQAVAEILAYVYRLTKKAG